MSGMPVGRTGSGAGSCGTNPLSHVQFSSLAERAGAVLLLGHAYMLLSPGQWWLSGHALQIIEGACQ